VYRSYNNELARSFIRIIIHPVLSFINNMVTATFVQDFLGTSPIFASGILLGTCIESAIFGQLMLVNIGSIGSTIGVTIGISAGNIFLRALVRRRISLVEWLFTQKVGPFCEEKCCCGCDEKSYYTSTIFYCMNSNYDMLTEISAIFVIPVMTFALYHHKLVFNLAYAEEAPQVSDVLILASVQLVIQLITNYVSIVIYRSQKLPIFETFAEEPIRTVVWEVLNYVQMISLILALTSSLPFRFFCPENGDTGNPCPDSLVPCYGNGIPCTCKNLNLVLYQPLCENYTAMPLF